MVKRIYILFAAIIISFNLAAQFNPTYRNVFWMHGLQGDVNSMSALADYFTAKYKINSYRLSYPSNRGVVFAGDQLNGMAFGEQPNDFAVAHSMGGLVTRQYYRQAQDNKKFGGLITICSPHQGAEFASSFDNGKISTLFNKSVTDGLQGYCVMGSAVGNLAVYHPNVLNVFNAYDSYMQTRSVLTENVTLIYLATVVGGPTGGSAYIWGANFLADFIGASGTSGLAEKIKNGVASSLQNVIGMAAEKVFGNKDEYFEYSKDDLKPTSSIIATLNQTPLPCPKIAIAATEDYPSGIRFLGSQLSLMSQNNPGIGDISDNNFQVFTKAIVDDSRICQNKYSDLYVNGSWLLLGLTNSYYRERRDAFSRQAAYWENGFEREYQKCLGSIYYTTETITYFELVNVCGGLTPDLPTQPIINNAYNDSDGCYKWAERTKTLTIEHIRPNDGIVNEPSQKGLAGAILPQSIPHTNHEEAKRSELVKNYLESQFVNPLSFFYLQPK